MSIADDLADALIDPRDARQVAGAIAAMTESKSARLELICQWEKHTGDRFPRTLLDQITGTTPIGTWPRNPEAHRGNPR